jgi:hypothetical protein|uniref:Uncharacterized protein n=1 Tax=Acidicaldus sp. TaxID=1872105 RepID=A0A8J4M6N3_9PROT
MSGAAKLRERLEAAGITLAIGEQNNLEWQSEADPPPELLAEARRLKPELLALLRAEAANDPGAEVEALAEALLAEAERHPATRIPDRAKALAYYRSEALRRLALIRQRAIDATTGPDIERAALMAEEAAPMASPEEHRAIVSGLLLAGLPGALACRGCGRGIWRSPSCRGAPPDLCSTCQREAETP